MALVIWGVVLAVGLFLADRSLMWLERRGLVYWRRHRAAGGGSASGAVAELHALLSPGHQHVVEEKERRLVLRDDADAGAPLDRRIDLDAGQVVIRTEGGVDGRTDAGARSLPDAEK
ncbi:DUF6191 domain-containing protein [Streptomyces sp. NPDC058657]|uniref:DUF6191 domain-containing protein n=1 Tax=unclassified Streptomyces TaxID=2593676 RepID=UPI0036541D82